MADDAVYVERWETVVRRDEFERLRRIEALAKLALTGGDSRPVGFVPCGCWPHKTCALCLLRAALETPTSAPESTREK